MKLATWNVNSLAVRLPHLTAWLQEHPVDALVLQETKLTDDKFPHAELAAAGWQAAWFGQKTYNGVALLVPAAQGSPMSPGALEHRRRVPPLGTPNAVKVIERLESLFQALTQAPCRHTPPPHWLALVQGAVGIAAGVLMLIKAFELSTCPEIARVAELPASSAAVNWSFTL